MLKTFSIGGVHPHENKLSAHQPIVQAEYSGKSRYLVEPAYRRSCKAYRC